MKYPRFYRYYYATLLFLMLFNLSATSQTHSAKTKPTPKKVALSNVQIMFNRAASLDKGMNLSWLEQTWNKNILSDTTLAESDYVLLKKLGFKSIRLPVAFTYFENNNVPLDSVLTHINKVLSYCKKYGFTLVVDYHYGNLNNDNYLTETAHIIELWQKVAQFFIAEGPGQLFFEIYNEPTVHDDIWKDAAYNIVQGIRKVDAKRTLLVGASNYNSIYELSRFVRLADDNIIYSFHFYEPFFFTHQGATWVGDQVATTGVSFPYNEARFPPLNLKAKNTWGETNYYNYKDDGNEQSLMDKLNKYVKPWRDKYNVPVVCTEYGVYNKYADQYSRCRYIKAMRATLKTLNMPGMMWEYNSGFSIFEGKPSINTLPECMKAAIGYTN
ncbi:aryl-phospho-beta-D-glucosidase BglC (GH1 family) [Mucilaginibacter gracilis]|uniref:Aryl-phospho-beta-D-glucosidase BglC (GH1 family) n=1 Tax=Mucilaginibacter gracilis TaxID=423350 RepID=A0A495ITE0_9SPHI|nr:cellulase family glycosylhydrolase [Mucilaginibacter gracilis]RKR80045.1 aryl-phospho-beta-D-glucosidase BglC (GH1 family) [Mucilaginibacter gracilis]